MPSSACYRIHPILPPFPTRRSSDLAPARSMAQRAAVTHYAATLQEKAGVTAKGVSPRASFGQHVAKVENLGELDANHPITVARMAIRSEEHTSELQSPYDLVCRLLLATASTPFYPLSLHDALPISRLRARWRSGPQLHITLPPCKKKQGSLPKASLRGPVLASTWPRLKIWENWTLTIRSLWLGWRLDRKSTRLNSSHRTISYAVFCLLPHPPHSTPFPYTTLFRSRACALDGAAGRSYTLRCHLARKSRGHCQRRLSAGQFWPARGQG